MLRQKLQSPKGKDLLRLARGSATFFLARVTGAAAAYCTQVMLARWLGGSEFGNYIRSFSWCIVLTNFALFGLGEATLRFVGMALASDDRGRLHGFVRATRVVVGGIGLLLASTAAVLILLFADSLTATDQTALLYVLLCIPPFALLQLDTRLAQSLSLYTLAAIPNNVARPTLLLAGVAGCWYLSVDGTAANVVLIHLSVIIVCAVALNRALAFKLRPLVRDDLPTYDKRAWFGTAWPLMLIVLFTRFFAEVNVIVISFFLPDQEIAIFNAAFRTALLISFSLFAIDSVTLPRVSKLYAQGDIAGMQRIVSMATRIKFGCSVIGMAILVIVGKPILGLFGEEFIRGYQMLLLLATMQIGHAALGPVAELLNVTGHHGKCLRVFACSLVVVVLSHLVLDPLLGIVGAALAVVLTTAFYGFWLRAIVIRDLQVRPSIFHLGRSH